MLIATLVLIFAIDIATDKGSETAEHTRSKFYPTEVMLGGGGCSEVAPGWAMVTEKLSHNLELGIFSPNSHPSEKERNLTGS